MASDTTSAMIGSAMGTPSRTATRPPATASDTNTSARVCIASATSTSLLRRRPARISYHTTVRCSAMLIPSATKLHTVAWPVISAGWSRRSTAERASSQVVMNRRTAMVSDARVSALRCP